MTSHSVGIIGSGLAGLSAACVLAGRGYAVDVFEANSWTGGKACQLSERGFRFDMGPTILIQPSVLRRVFAEAGAQLEDYVELVRLDPQWRCLFEDGSSLDLTDSEQANAAQISAQAPDAADGYRDFMRASRDLQRISNDFFFWRPLGSVWDTVNVRQSMNLRTLRDVLNMRMGHTVSQTIRSFVPNRNVAQMLEHYTQYVGSAPDQSPAVLCAIGAMQSEEGVWYPMGGTRAIPEALRKLAIERGVRFHMSAEVRRILHDRERATGIELSSGEQIPLAAVISNADSVRTYRELIGGPIQKKFDARRSYEAACSGVVLYLGLNKRYPHLAHHDFVFSRDAEEEFDAIYREGIPAPDPTCYLCAPATTDPAVAPAGGEALYVLVHTPYLRPGQDWKQMLPAYRRVILDKLKRTGGLGDIEDHIVFEAALTPLDIHERYRVLNGAIYGLASHGRLQGGFKPNNVSPDLRGLYLCGGAAHPGPGMPMVMMSGWIAADALDRSSEVHKLCRGAVA
ncbi:MAG TPA: phytoene desaturase family protein [Terriglobales bacterium]